jgi:DNA-binding transcriptional MocR family regulator
MPLRFSPYGLASTRPSPVNRMMAAFAADFRDGIDINLGVGYVNEKTIPADELVASLGAVADDPAHHRQPFNYGGPDGAPNLLDALRRFLVRERVGGLDQATLDRLRLIVGPCGATSILDALADLFQPGIVVTSDPMYYIYCDLLERKGFEVLAIPEDADGIDPALLDRALADPGVDASRIAFFFAVTVNNPSCTVLSNDRRRALVDVARRLARDQGRPIPIFFDQAYELLLHDPAAPPFASALPADADGLVYEIGTLSKILAPALRIGYLLGPPGPLIDALVQRTSDVGFSAPLFVQEMAAVMLDRHVGDQMRRVNAGYREKAVAVGRAIEDKLGPWLEACVGGRAGFYYYLTLRGVETHDASPFFSRLAGLDGHPGGDPRADPAPRVIYLPGQYCVHPRGRLVERGRRQLRLSYGFEPVERILRALDLMREAAPGVAPLTSPAPDVPG